MNREIVDGEDFVQVRIRAKAYGLSPSGFSCTLIEVHKVLDGFTDIKIGNKTTSIRWP
jgi:hypothetical protein